MPKDAKILDLRRELPVFFADSVEVIPATGVQLIRRSVQHLLQPGGSFSNYLHLGIIRFQWHFYMARKEEEIVFFFFRKDRPVRVILDTRLGMDVTPAGEPTPLFKLTDMKKWWYPPPFILLNPTRKLAAEMGVNPDAIQKGETLWLRLGNEASDIIYAHLPAAGRGAQFRMLGISGALTPRQLPVTVYLKLLDAIRTWVNGKLTAPPIPVESDDFGSEHIRTILQTMIQNFRTTNFRLRELSEQQIREHPHLEPILPYFNLTRYETKIRLYLTPEGEIANDDKDDPFQLEVTLEGRWMDGQPVILLRAAPPDFLVAGPLHQAFLDLLRKHREKVARKLDVSVDTLTRALDEASESGSIFRIERRGNEDTEMFALPFREGAHTRHLLFSGDFWVINAGEQPSVTLKVRSLKNLLDRDGQPRPQAIKYFVRLLGYIKDWKQIVIQIP